MITKQQYAQAQQRALEYYHRAGIAITPEESKRIEVADFNLGELEKIGREGLVYVNTDRVCAKELVLFPGQTCPEHIHPSKDGRPGKEETFRCRWGTVYLYVGGETNAVPDRSGLEPHDAYLRVDHQVILHPGEQYTLRPDTLHWFRGGEEGAVVSEFSTTSTDEEDLFTDPNIYRFTKIGE